MSRTYLQRKSLLALFMIAIFAISFNVTQGAATPPPAPLLKPTGIRLEYLGRDNYGYNYRVYLMVKNEGGAMTPNNTTTTPAIMLNINDSSGYGTVAVREFPMLAAGAEYAVAYTPANPITAFTYSPGVAAPAPDYRGLAGASLIIPTSTPYLYVQAGIMPNSKWLADNSLYKKFTKTFEIKDGRALESMPDFVVTDVRVIQSNAATNQQYAAAVKIKNIGGPAYSISDLKNYNSNYAGLDPRNLLVALRTIDKNKVKSGYRVVVKSASSTGAIMPRFKSGFETEAILPLPLNAKDLTGLSLKAQVNFNYIWARDNLNGGVINGIDLPLQNPYNPPYDGFIESNLSNNNWVGYKSIGKPDFSISNPRLLGVKENLPLMPKVISSSTPFACYPGQLKGDLDHDGKVTANDATLMTQAYLGVLKPVNMCCVDIDGNSKVEISEQQKVTNASLGLTKLGYCSPAVTQPKYFAVANVTNQGAPAYIGSTTVRVAFRISFIAGGKASTTAAIGYLSSKSGWLNKGSLGEVKTDMTEIFKKYGTGGFRITKHVVKIDASSVTDTTKGVLIEANDFNNTASSKQ
ncbi:hypothetical protein HGA34_00575 [Candidatus Falkowbacteria bacterium]|nr:hypothetical protein [Candidatus Falkowbacteria bacterium]